MTLFDHALIFLLFVVQPISSWVNFRRYVKKIQAGEPVDRPRLYSATQAVQWAFLAVLAGGWIYLARPASDLGFLPPQGSGFWLMAAAIAAGGIAMNQSVRSVVRLDQSERERLRKSFGDIGHFLPQSDRDLAGFYRLSVTAGIVEEIVFRGFVLWYLALIMPMWAAILVSSVAFGLGHSYQGAGGMLRTGLAGIALGVLFVISGSIWLPIVAHALLDWLQGRQIREIYRDVQGAATT
ncbi:MAG: CPBP family intramembrane metalloprotease [Woeseiaceae bacterium]|nr:CPBP family intramembrane metalloprotease [Woeseiaceae bacterium]